MGRKEARAHLGSTRDVDYGAPPLADDVEIPAPRPLVPDLARRAEDPKTRKIVLEHRRLAMGQKGPDEGRADAEMGDGMTLDHGPQAVRAGVVGRPLVKHDRRPVGEAAG